MAKTKNKKTRADFSENIKKSHIRSRRTAHQVSTGFDDWETICFVVLLLWRLSLRPFTRAAASKTQNSVSADFMVRAGGGFRKRYLFLERALWTWFRH